MTLGVGKSTSGGQRKSKCVAKLEKIPLFGVNFSIKKKRPGTDFVSIPGSFMGSVIIMDTIYGGNLTNAPLLQNLHPKVLGCTLAHFLHPVPIKCTPRRDNGLWGIS